MTTLLLEPVGAADIDLAFAAIPALTLWCVGGAVHASLDPSLEASATRVLAFAGVRATPSGDRLPGPTADLTRALGTGADAIALAGAEFEILDVRRVGVGVATARLLHRPVRFWPLAARRRSRVRGLLRATDVEFEVRRQAWCTRATIRAARNVLRPVLFDRGAAPGPLRVYAADRSLTRWARG